jgi:hypothetical protein
MPNMAEEFHALFLSNESLQTYFVFLCKSNVESSDPITDALVVLLTSNAQYMISRNGLVLFKGFPAYPFSIMNREQKNLIYQVVDSIRSEVHTYSHFARSENPLTYSVENQKLLIHIPPQRIDPKLVMSMLVHLIGTSSKPSLLLFNLIVQRLTLRVNINKETILFANEQGRSTLTTARGPEPQC